MGLIVNIVARIRHRVGYVWYWRVRHWWYDTREGALARRMALILALFLLGVQGIGAVIIAARTPQAPHQAIIGVIIILIVALLAGIAVALMTKKPPPAPDQQAKGPTTQDGKSAKRYYGTCCITEPALLAWKVAGRDAIMSKGGKK